MSVGRSVGPTQVSMCSSSDKTVLVYHVTMLQCCSVTMCYKCTWEKHLEEAFGRCLKCPFHRMFAVLMRSTREKHLGGVSFCFKSKFFNIVLCQGRAWAAFQLCWVYLTVHVEDQEIKKLCTFCYFFVNIKTTSKTLEGWSEIDKIQYHLHNAKEILNLDNWAIFSQVFYLFNHHPLPFLICIQKFLYYVFVFFRLQTKQHYARLL